MQPKKLAQKPYNAIYMYYIYVYSKCRNKRRVPKVST